MTLLARWAYSLLLTLLAPAYLLRLLWRARAEPLYSHALGERFGFYSQTHSQTHHKGQWVWLHAVSLGETRAAAALVDALRIQKPDLRLLLTHGTATGREAGRALLRDGDAQVWLPYDTPGAVRRFLKHFEPQVGVLMETEVWPQLLHQADHYQVPVLLTNGRLSERSLRRGQCFAALLRPAAEQLRLVMAQTPADAQRFKQFGAREVIVCGNLKFDMQPNEAQLALGRTWRKLLLPRSNEISISVRAEPVEALVQHAALRQAQGERFINQRAEPIARPVVLAASTREGEEAPLLAAWEKQTAGVPQAPLLVIVPRHPQRFDEVAGLIESAGFVCERRSGWTREPHPQALEADVWLGDSIGEMALYYSLAHVALLGGSFAPLGGQNLIEAAACGCPVVMGPHTFNFAQAAELAVQAGAAWRVADVEDAVARSVVMLTSGEQDTWSEQARRFAGTHRGAANVMASQVLKLLKTKS